jgi:hypothetical protein
MSKSQNYRESGYPEFISGSDIQCDGILKQVQDDWIQDFLDTLMIETLKMNPEVGSTKK